MGSSSPQRIQLGLIPGLDHTLVDGEWVASEAVRHQATKNDIQVAAAAGAFVPGDRVIVVLPGGWVEQAYAPPGAIGTIQERKSSRKVLNHYPVVLDQPPATGKRQDVWIHQQRLMKLPALERQPEPLPDKPSETDTAVSRPAARGSIDAADSDDDDRGFKSYPASRQCIYRSPFSAIAVDAIALGERMGLIRIEYVHRGAMAESDVPPATVEFTAPSLSCVTDKEEPVTQELVTQDISYQQQYRRCGKPTCGTCPHGPYWYAYWRDGAKVKSRYIGKELHKELHKSATADSFCSSDTSI
ncbi:hypothetical protein [Neosynechococcus sphagnicola]|nr:hypothetical protein [Neosynechococcus sphagnicola]